MSRRIYRPGQKIDLSPEFKFKRRVGKVFEYHNAQAKKTAFVEKLRGGGWEVEVVDDEEFGGCAGDDCE